MKINLADENKPIYIMMLLINGVNILPIFEITFAFINCASSHSAILELFCYLSSTIFINTISNMTTNTPLLIRPHIRIIMNYFSDISMFIWLIIISYYYKKHSIHLNQKLISRDRVIYILCNLFLSLASTIYIVKYVNNKKLFINVIQVVLTSIKICCFNNVVYSKKTTLLMLSLLIIDILFQFIYAFIPITFLLKSILNSIILICTSNFISNFEYLKNISRYSYKNNRHVLYKRTN